MLFHSTVFLFVFLPLVFGGNALMSKKYANAFLLLCSVFFYAWGEPSYVWLMLWSIGFNHVCAIAIDRRAAIARRQMLTLGVCLNLLPLIFFKYRVFIIGFFSPELAASFAESAHLPIGISFYTFQAISYLIDVARGSVKAEKNPITTGLYVCLFPQLIAGPIVRFKDITRQLHERTLSSRGIETGIKLFIKGLSKKLLIADALAAVADASFVLSADERTAAIAWMGAICYALQIYYDFSGYSDMAVGLGRMFGFTFPVNFRHPYVARSITDFWRRWHISLTDWFKDYVYVPLGGNRGGRMRTTLHLIAVFTLSGLWHGAGLNFVLWGFAFGTIIALEKTGILRRITTGVFLSRLYVSFVVIMGWVLFRSPDLVSALSYMSNMFDGEEILNVMPIRDTLNRQLWICLTIGLIGCTPALDRARKVSTVLHPAFREAAEDIVALGAFLLCLGAMASNTYSPFIYFQF